MPSRRLASSVQRAYEQGVIQESLVNVATRSSDLGWGLAVADEQPRPDTTVEALATLRTPFRPHGRVTAGNAAGLNDGATACWRPKMWQPNSVCQRR